MWQENINSSKQWKFTEQDIRTKNINTNVYTVDPFCSLSLGVKIPVWQDQPSSIYFACLPPKSILTNFQCPGRGDWLKKQ